MMTKYTLRYTVLFKRQRKHLIRRGYDISELDAVIAMLANAFVEEDRGAIMNIKEQLCQ